MTESESKNGIPAAVTNIDSLTEEQKNIVQLMRVVRTVYYAQTRLTRSLASVNGDNRLGRQAQVGRAAEVPIGNMYAFMK